MNFADPVLRVRLILPRHAIGPRQVARAGEIWRLFQECAVQASIRAGWPPSRYRDAGTGFVVGAMTVVHHREVHADANIETLTWVRDFRRGLLTRRQVQLVDGPTVLAEATQSWVHVGEHEGELRPMRATDELIAAFPAHLEPGPVTRLPAWTWAESLDLPNFDLELWHGWMDPMGHANHPAYIDWCDEALCRALVAAGHDPTTLVAAGEQVRWREAALARDRVSVRSRLVGRSAHGVVFRHELVNLRHGRTHATAMTVRSQVGDPGGVLLEEILRGRSE